MKKSMLALALVMVSASISTAAKRFYFVKVIGDGSFSNPWRADADGFDHAGMIPTGTTGTPLRNWCLVMISTDATGQSVFNARTGTIALPEKRFLDNLTTTEMTNIKNFLTNHGIDPAGIDATTDYDSVIRRVGRKLDSNYDEQQNFIGGLP